MIIGKTLRGALTVVEAHPEIDRAVCYIAAGLLLAWWIMKPPPPKPETYKPEIVQTDGSHVLERTPIAAADLTPPPVIIPPGTHESRRISVDIQPTGKPFVPVGAPVGTAPVCPKVHVDVSIAKAKDGSARAIVKSPDGEVIGGADIPIDLVEQPREWKNAFGFVYGNRDRQGIFYDRDFYRLRTGGEVFRERGLDGQYYPGASVKLGFRW